MRLMKISLDLWETPKAEFEPHVPASLLKVDSKGEGKKREKK